MADRRIHALTQKPSPTGNESVAIDESGDPEVQRITVQQIADLVPGGGVTDHGALTGLEDDDHTQYHTDTRHDARDIDTHNDVAGGATEGQALVRRAGVWTPEALPSGVTDHGALNGLDGDDHPQYMLVTTYDAAGIAEQVVGTAAVQTVGNKTLDKIRSETRTPDVRTGVTGATSLDVGAANVFDMTLSGATTFSFDSPPTTGTFTEFVLVLRGNQTVTLPASVVWDGGAAPTLSGGLDVLGFWTVDAGTTWVANALALGAA